MSPRANNSRATDAQLQAKYTDLLLLNKHAEVSERNYDILMDALGELNDETPRIRISPDSPPKPEILFGLDTKLFEAQNEESSYWDKIGKDANWHGDEVETKTVWSGGVPPGQGAKRKRADAHAHEHDHGQGECGCGDEGEIEAGEVLPISNGDLDAALAKLNFEIYRGRSHLCLGDAWLIRSERPCADTGRLGARVVDAYPQLGIWAIGPHAGAVARRGGRAEGRTAATDYHGRAWGGSAQGEEVCRECRCKCQVVVSACKHGCREKQQRISSLSSCSALRIFQTPRSLQPLLFSQNGPACSTAPS